MQREAMNDLQSADRSMAGPLSAGKTTGTDMFVLSEDPQKKFIHISQPSLLVPKHSGNHSAGKIIRL